MRHSSIAQVGRQKAVAACLRSKELEAAGEYYEAARELTQFWRGVGFEPDVAGLSTEDAAEVTLRAGSLTGWIGNARQIDNAQDTAKDLLGIARREYTALGNPQKASECAAAIALCYWRQGGFDEARVILQSALSLLSDCDLELKISVLLNCALVEWSDHRFTKEMEYQNEVARLIQGCQNSALLGRFHHGNAMCWKSLQDEDRAFIEYSMASKYYEEAGHQRFCARVENNLAGLYLKKGLLDEACSSVEKAILLFNKLSPPDRLAIAATEETRARILLASNQLHDAERAASHSVSLLEQGDGDAIMVENLTTYGVVLARLGKRQEAIETFKRAYDIALTSISVDRASQIASIVMDELRGGNEATFAYSGLSMDEAVRKLREKMIREALEESKGDVRLAAMRLGVKNYQNLQYYVNKLPNRYANLQEYRPPILKRNRKSKLSLVKEKG